MIGRFAGFSFLLILGTVNLARGQAPPPGDNKPLLRLEAGGPTSNVTALAFSPDGDTLYAAGFDKVVRVWGWNAAKKLFELDDKRYFRVPINPGTEGAINAMALSPAGDWLAVGGRGVVRVAAGFHQAAGRVWPMVGLTPELRADQGLIYVFSTRRQEVRLLRGHSGEILSLAFAPAQEGKPPLLVSAARGWNFGTNKVFGEARVWDVAKGVAVAALTGLPPPHESGLLPGLAAVHTGPKLNQLRVAIAWGDEAKNDDGARVGYLRLWDLNRPKKQVRTFEDGYHNTALALLPDGTSLLAGSFSKAQGRLREWDLAADSPTITNRADLPAPGANAYFFPDRLALFAAHVDGPTDHVAVLLRGLTKAGDKWAEENRLHLLDLRGNAKVEVPLWKNNSIGPVLASGGRHLAVAGNKDHSILVYAVADLLQQKIQPQVLHSVGATLRQLAFATRTQDGKKRLGLLLSETPGPLADGSTLVFDFDQRELAAKVQGWTIAGPDPGDWRTERTPKTKPGEKELIRVFQGDQLVRQIDLPAEQWLNALALLPPRAPLHEPLLVVAAYVIEKGLPILEVYQARTGKMFRWYTGHTAPITALAFSPDGKLLASAANDQTIAVWSLKDLDEILQRQGRLTGVAVEKRGQDLVVARVDEDGPANVSAGAVIESLTLGDKEIAPKTARDFYETFWKEKPGTKVTLRLVVANQKKNVTLTVDQGIDERKPLFSLFVTRPGPAGTREWLGWNALGPFDAANPTAEKYLGWHFNTGQAKEPTKFALIEEYRKSYFKKDILKYFIKTGSLEKALEEHGAGAKRPIPKIQEILAAKAANGDAVIRQREAALQLPIHDFTPERGDVVEWQLDGGQPMPLDPPSGISNQWSLPLPAEFFAKAGSHQVRVSVRLPDRQPELKEITVRYQPPAPRLQLPEDKPAAGKNAVFPFKALVHTPGEGPGVKVSLWLNGQKNQKAWDLKRAEEPQEISEMLNLKEGANLIKVQAQNDPALKGFEDEERHVSSLQVAVITGAPFFTFQRIEALGADEGSLKFELGQKINVPRVRIVGTIQAQTELASAEWSLGEKLPLAKFQPGKKEFTFSQEVTLQPGEQTIRFFAKTTLGKATTESLSLVYSPQLPILKLLANGKEEVHLVIREAGAKDKAEITLEGTLTPPPVPSPTKYKIKATIWRDGKEVPGGPIELVSTADKLPPRKIALEPGLNRFKVVLAHDWSDPAEPAQIDVSYVRPPRILEPVKATPVGKLPFVDLRAEVESPLKPLAASVKVEVNGQAKKFADAQIKPAGAGAWVLEVKEVPLTVAANQQVPKNEIKLAVANAEASSDPSKPVSVEYKAPPPPPPKITLVSPSSPSTQLSEPEVNLVFSVNSAGPPKRLEVTQGREVLFRTDKFVPLEPGLFQVETGLLPLQWGTNSLKVTAVNDGGPKEMQLTFSVPPHPVAVSLDLLRDATKGTTFSPSEKADGKRIFPSVPAGKMFLEGMVRWSGPDDALLKKKDHEVRIYVNGFQQVPVKLGPAPPDKPWQRPFKARLLLNLPDNNIEVQLPGLPQETRNKDCAVACQNPVRGQHLHLLLVAPGLKREEGKKLETLIAEALRLQPKANLGPKFYQSKVFDLVHLNVMAGNVKFLTVDSALFNIRGQLNDRARQGAPNDVVMIYFLGKETVTPQGRFLWTSDTYMLPKGPEKALRLDNMVANHFSQFPGAQVLFLDVGSDKTLAKILADEERYRLAFFEHVQPGAPLKTEFQKELMKGMSQVAWLEKLADILGPRFQERFMGHHPEKLRMRINPDP